MSQLLDEGFEVLFWPGGSRILDSRGDLVCMVVPEGQVFGADFSQSSGVAERKNRTLCEMARTMLDEHRTPRRFWAKAVNTACYASNRIYLRVHKKKTCFELMLDRTPKVSHFHSETCYLRCM
jgi:hypothetical protein